MSDFPWSYYGFCIVGIIVSVLLPPLWSTVRSRFKVVDGSEQKDFRSAIDEGWQLFKPYVVLGLASSLTAILVIAVTKDKIAGWEGALLAGYAWDSTLQKLTK